MPITDSINRYKNKIVNIAIIILALIIANNIYKGQARTQATLKEKKDAETRKNTVLMNINQLEKSINTYKDLRNKKDTSSVINTLTNMAKDSGVKIIVLKPSKEEVYPAYIKYPFDLTVGLDSYHALGRFVSKLESHADIYILELATIRQAMIEGREAVSTDKLIADLKVYTLKVGKD